MHLGNVLRSRYKVIHKLGSGGYANVWLCRDIASATPRYVALKIIMGEASTKGYPELRVNELLSSKFGEVETAEYFCLALDRFEINGPNGTHLVFVYPVLGPRVSRLLGVSQSSDPGRVLKEICLQVTQGMADLHRRGMCHGGMYTPQPLLGSFLTTLPRLSTGQHFGPNKWFRWTLRR